MYHNPTRAAMDAVTDSKPRRVGMSASVASLEKMAEGYKKKIEGMGLGITVNIDSFRSGKGGTQHYGASYVEIELDQDELRVHDYAKFIANGYGASGRREFGGGLATIRAGFDKFLDAYIEEVKAAKAKADAEAAAEAAKQAAAAPAKVEPATEVKDESASIGDVDSGAEKSGGTVSMKTAMEARNRFSSLLKKKNEKGSGSMTPREIRLLDIGMLSSRIDSALKNGKSLEPYREKYMEYYGVDIDVLREPETAPSPEVKPEPVAAAEPDFKPHSKWSLQDVSYAGVITKPAVAEYKKTPGSLNAAASAAAFYAKRDGVDMAVIEGNSYGSRVYQIQELTKDIAAITVMRAETNIVIAKPDGKLYKAKAVPVADEAPAAGRFDAAIAAVEARRVYVKHIKSVAGGWIRTFGIRDGDTIYQRPDSFNPTGAEPADNGAWAMVTRQELDGYIDYIEKRRAGVFYDAGMRLLNTVKNADEIIANGKSEAAKRDEGLKAYEDGVSAYNNAPEVDPKSVEVGDTFTNHLGVKYKAVEVGNYGPVFVKEGDPEERQVTLGKLRGTLVKADSAAEPVQPQPSKTLNQADFTYRYEGEAIAILNAALEADEIRKVDFEAVKSSINRAIDMQRNEIQKAWLSSRDKDAETYPLEEDLYYNSMSLNTLNSAKKKAMKVQETYIGAANLKLIAKYEPVAAALEELKPKIVTRQVKTEEQKAAEKADKLIPKTAASAALFSAIDNEVETKRPAIVADIKAGIERLLSAIQKRRGESLASMFASDASPDARRDEGIFGSEIARLLTDEEFIQKKRSALSAIERNSSVIKSVPPLEKIRLAREIAAQVAIVDAVPVLDDAKMEAYANRQVDEMFAAIKVKMLEKAGEIENPKVEDLSHYQFAITGQMKGRTVRIEQDIIINRSANGKAFNQFPARIYVDGKFTSEADYKTMMTA